MLLFPSYKLLTADLVLAPEKKINLGKMEYSIKNQFMFKTTAPDFLFCFRENTGSL